MNQDFTHMTKDGYLLGFDVGSSSVKASILDIETGSAIESAHSPAVEMRIISKNRNWAEQDPETWWKNLCLASKAVLRKSGVNLNFIKAIGISYQMHGLVIVDENQKVLRPSIIWCDSRASEIGQKAFSEIGQQKSLENYLNSPGNFTASKLKWVKENETELYKKIHKMMLPGDFIAMKMTGEISTTFTGLSEGILWDYKENGLANSLLNHFEISDTLIPDSKESFADHGKLTASGADELGLPKGIPITYKAGDQPNNAFSLNVLHPGEAATTAGTSGVIYGVSDKPVYDKKSRVNTFVHVNHENDNPSYGVLICINGTGILYRWIKQNLIRDETFGYDQMNNLALQTPIGADGLRIMPFGNGAERILENRNPGAKIVDLHFNRHDTGHLLRAALEGIVFSMNYGFSIMKEMNMDPGTIRAGRANLFLSPLFREAFANSTETVLELYNTDGSEGAARGAGLGAGIFSGEQETFSGLQKIETIEPDPEKAKIYRETYENWLELLL